MTSFEEFLSMLQNRDIKVWAEGEDLRCNAPKGVITPEIREQLVKHKAEILTYLHKENGTSRFRHEPIQPLAGNKNLPLSFAQQRLWFLDQLEGGSSAYNMPAAFQMKGPLHIKGLEQSLTEMVRRHEVLRTVFLQLNGSPIQTINPPETMIIPLIDLQHLSRKEQESKTRRLIAEEAKCPFDLARGPLLRASLLRLDDNSHILLVTMHHIVTDGWSIVIFIKELASLYSAFSKGETISLPELPIQYADYAYWQREVLQGETLETLLDYWKQQLAGAPPLLELPLDRPRPALQSFRGSFIPFELDSLHMDGMKKLSREAGATLFMPLLTAFATLLSRYSGQEDIVVGTPIANRNRAEVEGLIGFFANTLALRIRLSGNPTFRELLDQVRETTIGAYEHQDLPFEKLVEELQPERHLSYNPLVQVVFVLQNIPLNAPTPALKLRGLDLTPMEFDHGTVRMDLEVHLWEVPEGCKGYFIYNTDLFDAATINRMIGHFQSIVKSVSFNPNQFALELSMLTDVERHQLASGWNRTNKDYFQNKCIHTVFEALAEQRPGATAVIYEDKKLSYRELNDRANQLARYLQSRGIGPEVPVAICLERSLEMMVGLLGILKAGGAYVPLDPAYPDDRLTFMLKDSMAPVLLTQQNLVFRLPEIKDQNSENQHPTIICLDRDSDIISKEYTDNLRSGVHSKNLAYIIYTSGSTGKPKGTMIQHKSLLNFVESAIDEYGIQKSDRVLQFASICFDASVEEIFPSLLSGGCLILRTDEMLDSVTGFLEKCEEMKITVLDLPTAYWHEVVAEFSRLKLTLPETLRLLIIGGERANPEDVGVWNRLIGDMPI
ncbi:MAG: AMP-binding protein, partial [Calditrichaeota bacterium]|nr:AMP-binding protein [Calditrichota bacterium]